MSLQVWCGVSGGWWRDPPLCQSEVWEEERFAEQLTDARTKQAY